ncbi:MAG: hypothetical protein IT460_03990 [Planctomycetes bacterium]|nr:hypothetical protein [Planctomycetota bacterium]
MPFLFFATRQDLLAALLEAEQKQAVRYVLAAANETGKTQQYLTAAEIPDLGVADHPNAIACRGYLVTERARSVAPRRVVSNDGAVWYAIDQMINPNTIEVSPGGLWEGTVLLNGRVETVSGSECARTLLKTFRSAIRKRCSKIGAYWVGSEAGALLDAGKRLTMGVQCPPGYDLKRDKTKRG